MSGGPGADSAGADRAASPDRTGLDSTGQQPPQGDQRPSRKNRRQSVEGLRSPEEGHHSPEEVQQQPEDDQQLPQENRQPPEEGRHSPEEDRHPPEENGQQQPQEAPGQQWHRFSKVTPYVGLLKIWGFIALAVMWYFRDRLEGDDGFDSFRDFVVSLLLEWAWRIALVMAAVSLVTVAVAWLRWRFAFFSLRDDGIHRRSGVLVKKHLHMRWDRVQTVNVERKLLARMFGLASLRVESGTEAMGSPGITLGLLRREECEGLRRAILTASDHARRGLPVVLPAWHEGSAGRAEVDAEHGGLAAERAEVETGHEVATEREGLAAGRGTAEHRDAPEHRSLAAEDDQRPVYTLPTGRLVVSLVLSFAMVRSLIALAGSIFFVLDGSLLSLPLLFLLVEALWDGAGSVSKKWGTAIFLARGGVVWRSGLSSVVTNTIPPGRVHAIKISQPLLWRPMGWWRMSLLVAGHQEAGLDESRMRHFIPVGKREDVERMVWVLAADLGIAEPAAVLDEAFDGQGAGEHFIAAPPSARFVAPFAWKRSGICLTPTVAVLRKGRVFVRSIRLIHHEHFQGLSLRAGLVAGRLGLARVLFRTVGADFEVVQKNLALDDAIDVLAREGELGRRARRRRDGQNIEQWRERVGVADA